MSAAPESVVTVSRPPMGLFAVELQAPEFELESDFLESYRAREPKWGPIGYITYKRTYSRFQDPERPGGAHRTVPIGESEDWWQTVARVVEGCYRIQQRHCQHNHLHWRQDKAQRSAQEMYRLIFEFKFLPPGRGLWMMGTEYIKSHGSASLNNCFASDTRVWMDGRLVRLSDAVGQTVEVLAGDGLWRSAPVRSFGVQKLQKVEFAPKGIRSNFRLSYDVTPDHRWILADGSETTSLKVGDEVRITPHETKSDPVGFAHGLIFGDGTRHTYYPKRHIIRLCGDKAQYRSVLEAVPGYVSTVFADGDPLITIVRDGENWKAVPDDTKPVAYQRGFLEGWIAADGGLKPAGSVQLDSTSHDALDWLIERAPLLGFCVLGDNLDSVLETNFGKRSEQIRRLTLSAQPTTYKVKSIMDEGREEEVFCVTEAVTRQFTLEGGLVTGNCAFISTKDIAVEGLAEPFITLMDLSMLGVGVGFDTDGAGQVVIQRPTYIDAPYVIPDSREGWMEAARMVLDAYQGSGGIPRFDYSIIRPEGTPIRGFGGVAAGPEPLRKLLEEHLPDILNPLVGAPITSEALVDVGNAVGKCVVSGNVRRSAEIAFGSPEDESFLRLKDPEVAGERLMGPDSWRWASNNSLYAQVGMDYSGPAAYTAKNGEPGYIWLDNIRRFGRLIDPPTYADVRAKGCNPCVEQSLEPYELCCLVETFPAHHESYGEWERTLKFAYLYAKTVTLLPTHIQKVNAVMMRNRRIGTSQSGIVQNFAKVGRREHFKWCDQGYRYLRNLDNVYSEWLAVPKSVKITSVKPSGTVSKLCGATAGMHRAPAEFYVQRMRFAASSPLLTGLRKAGFHMEPDVYSPNSVVVEFPVHEANFEQAETDVPAAVQMGDAVQLQRYWADNQVSCTVKFEKAEEGPHIKDLLELYEDQLKGISFLPYDRPPVGEDGVPKVPYAQAPWEPITEARYRQMLLDIEERKTNGPLHLEGDTHEVTDKFCDGDRCTV